MKPIHTTAIKIAAVALSGLLFASVFPGYSFPTFGVPYVFLVAFVPLFVVLQNAKGRHPVLSSFLYIWIYAFVFQLTAFFWVSQPIIYFSSLSEPVGYLVFVLASALTSFYFFFLFSPILFNIWRKNKYHTSDIPSPILALLITALEICIPRFFNWSIGQSFNNIYFSQLSSLFGFNTGTFFVLLTNLTLARALTKSNRKNLSPIGKTIGMNAVLWSCVFLFGFLRVQSVDKVLTQSKKIRVAYIQPNFTFQELAFKRIHAKNAQEISLKTVVQMSEDVIEKSLKFDNKRPDLLVWPESVAPDTIFMNRGLQEIVINYSKNWQVPILVQDAIWKRDPIENSISSVWSVSKVISPDGVGSDSFQKWVPIPFGESFPLERVFPKLGKWYRGIIANSSKVELGTNYRALNVQNNFFVAPLICFDSIYPRLPWLQAQRGGADLFINQANFMWMVDSNAGLEFGYLDQHRAIENARSMIMVSNTGPTVVYDPLGRILLAPTELMSSNVGFVDIPLYDGKTIFGFTYNWPLLIIAGLATGIYAFMRRLRSKSS